MRKGVHILIVCLGSCLVASNAFSQQAKSDSELGLSGSFTVPHNDPSTANGEAQISYGYYFSNHDLLGMDTVAIVSNSLDIVFVQGRYRHLFGGKNAKVFPFVGAAGGVDLYHFNGSTSHFGLGTGEAGVKFFVSQKTAFEVAYNFQYINQVPGGSFTQNSQSMIVFGFTHLFGGRRR